MWPSPPSTGQRAFYMNQICSSRAGRLTACAFSPDVFVLLRSVYSHIPGDVYCVR